MVTHRSRRDSRFARVALTAVAVWVGVALAPPARGAEDLCGATISDDLRLDQDLVCLADGLTVGADGIQINLDGHSITGAGSGVGIKIEGHSGVTIFGDGTIANFMTGVRIVGSAEVVIKDTVLDGHVDGIDVQAGSRGIVIKANEISSNSTRGIMLRSGVTDVDVKNNTFTGNRVGVLVNGPTRSVVRANFITSSPLAGIRVGTTATANLLLDNIVVANLAGIEFLTAAGAGATGNTIKDNTVTANECGLKGPTTGNRLQGNYIAANTVDICG